MKKLILNNLRYLFKNKIIVISIFILLIVAIMVFGAFTKLSTSISRTYNNLVQKYNLHNIVINEKYSQNETDGLAEKQQFENELSKIGVEYRQFNSININNTTNDEIIKVVEYLSTYTIDTLDIFDQNGLPKSLETGNYVLPNAIDFNSIIDVASQNLSSNATPENILARQKLIYFISRSNINVTKFQTEFNDVWNVIKSNNNYDPANPGSNPTTSEANVAKYIKAFLNPNDPNYSPFIVRGNRFTCTLTKFNKTLGIEIPATGYFEDPYGLLAVVSNDYVEANKKKIYSFTQFRNDISNVVNTSQTDGLDLLPNKVSDFPDIKSTLDINNWLDNLSDDYKIYVNNIPYLIVGSGITPDFMYPIISFENTIPNPRKEAILYANQSGYYRAETSFLSSPHESFLLAKYNGDLSKTAILNEINMLAKKSMSWPSNVTPAYWYNDLNNQLSPSSLRITFISTVISTFVGIVVALTIFVVILIVFAMLLFVKKFINSNKTNIAIIISNGVNKNKILWSIAIIASFLCIVSAPIGLLLSTLLENVIFTFLSSYWFLPTPISAFGVGWYILAILIPAILFTIIIFAIGLWLLKSNLVSLMRQNFDLKISKPYLLFRKMIAKANVIYKFRSSLVFSSFTKIFLITLLSLLSISTLSFAMSSTNKLTSAYQLEAKTNNSTYAIDLVTPTTQGGQYFGLPLQYMGQELYVDGQKIIPSTYATNSPYSTEYNNVPLFKNYSNLFWASSKDSDLQKTNIQYLFNKIETQVLLNFVFGIGNASINPWNISRSLMPLNQINSSINATILLLQKMLSDMRPYNQAYFSNITQTDLTPITPVIDKTILGPKPNAIAFPSEWVIQNFNELDNPNSWSLSYQNNPNIGVINASEIFNDDANKTLRWLTPSDVLKDAGQLSQILNDAYNTYGTSVTSTVVPNDLNSVLYAKYYPNLFTAGAISNVRIEGNVVRFNVDTTKNTTKSLITIRSMLLRNFMNDKKVALNDDNKSELLTGNIILDPLDTNSMDLKEYGFSLDKQSILGLLGLKIQDGYIKLILSAYKDPAYLQYFYRILSNMTVLDDKSDEPYVYIKGIVQNTNDTVKILGIMNDSKFIKLYNNKNRLINNELLNNNINDAIPLIINNYAAYKYKLKIGDTLTITTNNETTRYNYADQSKALEMLKVDNPSFTYQQGKPVKYQVIDINNTGNNAQFYVSLANAQKIVGLATAQDYIDKTNIDQKSPDGSLTIGMNNRWNSFGGFNGVFTNLNNPIMLSTTTAIYSPSGIYPCNDMWSNSAEMVQIVKNTFTNQANLAYLAQALEISMTDFNNLRQSLNSTGIDDNKLANRILNLLSNKYGNIAYNTIYENAIALAQQELMFNQLSATFNEIMVAISALLILLSLIIIIIITSMVISELLKVSSIMKTLGYSTTKNTLTFFSIFFPAWCFAWLFSIPLVFILNLLLKQFLYMNLSLFIPMPFNWLTFIISGLLFGIIFTFIFFWGRHFFKRNNILEVLKW